MEENSHFKKMHSGSYRARKAPFFPSNQLKWRSIKIWIAYETIVLAARGTINFYLLLLYLYF